jgi:hypothetical protein
LELELGSKLGLQLELSSKLELELELGSKLELEQGCKLVLVRSNRWPS